MQKIIFMVLIVFVSCKSKQEIMSSTKEVVTVTKFKNPKYKPLHQFKGDTLKYLQSNFLENKNYYLNKPLNALMDDLEIDIKTYVFTNSGENLNFCPSIGFSAYEDKQVNKKIKKTHICYILYGKYHCLQKK